MYAEAAKTIDAVVSADLLISIFIPGGPLHDGAAVIRGNRVVAAGAFLVLAYPPCIAAFAMWFVRWVAAR